jgi:hypothetical protein
MVFIRQVKTASGATAVQLARKAYGRIDWIDHIGSAHTETDLELLLTIAKGRLHQDQLSLFDQPSRLDVKLTSSESTVLRDAVLSQYAQLGFDKLNDPDFAYLCLARIVEPSSKLDSLRILTELGIDSVVGEDQLYRCLKRVIAGNYRDKLSELCFAHASKGSGISLVLYDVTTLYFEIQKEDEDDLRADGTTVVGYRKSGLSKERRLEPQIVVGLLVDQTGFPLELHSFEGNKAETKTILPIINAFRKRHGLVGITVVADAGMLSADNLDSLAQAGYSYIVGSRLNKIPYGIAEYQKLGNMTDNQIVHTATGIKGQRIIYQYRQKRAALDLRNIQKQINKAEKILNGTAAVKRARFLSVATKEKKLNQALIDKARALAGIKGYVTNLKTSQASDAQIIAYYHQLWRVEQSFRMSKNDLRARPIFHHKREAIEAHLTIVMAAMSIGRTIERKTGLSIKKFVKLLKPIRSGTVIINGKTLRAEAQIPETVSSLLVKLGRGTN